MKQKVTITFTIDPREYGHKGNALFAVMLAGSMMQKASSQMQPGTRIRVSSRKVVRYYTPRP